MYHTAVSWGYGDVSPWLHGLRPGFISDVRILFNLLNCHQIAVIGECGCCLWRLECNPLLLVFFNSILYYWQSDVSSTMFWNCFVPRWLVLLGTNVNITWTSWYLVFLSSRNTRERMRHPVESSLVSYKKGHYSSIYQPPQFKCSKPHPSTTAFNIL